MDSYVAPFAGAWIEIEIWSVMDKLDNVAPFAGAWIEIPSLHKLRMMSTSLPSRERGLK